MPYENKSEALRLRKRIASFVNQYKLIECFLMVQQFKNWFTSRLKFDQYLYVYSKRNICELYTQELYST